MKQGTCHALSQAPVQCLREDHLRTQLVRPERLAITVRRGASDAAPGIMPVPVDITFRGMTPSASVEAAVQRWADRIEHSYGRIQRCTVVIEQPHKSQRHGQTFHVRVDLSVPERTISTSRDPGRDPGHEDVYVAIADAFRAARRQLQDHVQILRGEVKLHA